MNKKKTDITKVIPTKLRVFEAFAGIGAQNKAITNIDKTKQYFEVVKTSEWDARAIMAYASIHHMKRVLKEIAKVKKWTDEEVNNYFSDKTFSLNSKTPSQITRKDRNFKNHLIAANIVNNNNPDITKVSGKTLDDIDLLTYSFPCQGLSIANMGRGKGIDPNSTSTSNLIWQIDRMLREAQNNGHQLPKYLLMENVPDLIGKKYKPDYDKWTEILKEEFNYKTFTLKINALNQGSLQTRKRVFGISILNYDGNLTEDKIEKIINELGKKKNEDERKEEYERILKASSEDEILSAIPNNTPSRIRMGKDNHNLDPLKRQWTKGNKFTFNTLTTKQDRHPNIGMMDVPKNIKVPEGKLDKRFITTREAYLIMGFTNKDYDQLLHINSEHNKLLTKECVYRQAGNSIVVNVLESIFKFIKNYERGKYE